MGRRASFYGPLSSQAAWPRPGTGSVIEDVWLWEMGGQGRQLPVEGSWDTGILQDQVARGWGPHRCILQLPTFLLEIPGCQTEYADDQS